MEGKQPLLPLLWRRSGKVLLVAQSGFYQSLRGAQGLAALGSSLLINLFQCEASKWMRRPGMCHTGESLSSRESVLLGRDTCFKVWSSVVSSWHFGDPLASCPASALHFPLKTSVLHLPVRDKAGWWLVVRSPGKVWITTRLWHWNSYWFESGLTSKVWVPLLMPTLVPQALSKGSFSCVVRWESKEGGPASSPAFGEGFFHKSSCLFDFKSLHYCCKSSECCKPLISLCVF